MLVLQNYQKYDRFKDLLNLLIKLAEIVEQGKVLGALNLFLREFQ